MSHQIKALYAIYWVTIINGLADGLVGIFVPVFLLTKGYGVA